MSATLPPCAMGRGLDGEPSTACPASGVSWVATDAGEGHVTVLVLCEWHREQHVARWHGQHGMTVRTGECLPGA